MSQVNRRLFNWQGLNSDTEEEYASLRRALRRKNGFGLFFVQCSPDIGKVVTAKIEEDLPRKNIATLELTESIDSLYDLVAELAQNDDLDILFISGLEHSLRGYEKANFADNSPQKYTYSWQGVPRFLGYLNLQRDRFRENFNTSLVFLLPAFGINYFINRAPDFFDWRSGLFEFIPDQESLLEIDIDHIFKAKPEQCQFEILELETLAKDRKLTTKEQLALADKQFLLCFQSRQYEQAIIYLDRYLTIKPDQDEAWYNRGNALKNLGRYEEAVASYDRALEFKPDDDEAWYNRGVALKKLNRIKESITSFERACEINPDYKQI